MKNNDIVVSYPSRYTIHLIIQNRIFLAIESLFLFVFFALAYNLSNGELIFMAWGGIFGFLTIRRIMKSYRWYYRLRAVKELENDSSKK